MNAYTAKNFSVADDFKAAATVLENQGFPATMVGMTLHTTASMDGVQATVRELWEKGENHYFAAVAGKILPVKRVPVEENAITVN